jgi:hypothetical protein
MIIGLITVLVSRKIFHLDSETDLRSQTRIALFSSMAALGANVILDPLVGYFYKTYIFGIPQDLSAALARIGSVTTLVNAIASTIAVTVLWPALHRALSRAGSLA